MKTKYKIFYMFILLCFVTFAITGCTKEYPFPVINTSTDVKNVILIVGDGMGYNHIENAKTYYDMGTLAFEKDYVIGVDTSSKSLFTTDSAAAATALATGYNVKNGKIGMDGNKTLTNIMEIAKDNNKKTGIITTDNLYGATPAAFSSHAKDRDYTNNIIVDQYQSNVDLMIGEKSSKYQEYYQNFTSNGYSIYEDYNSLVSSNTNNKILANISNLRSIYNPNITGQVNLVDIVSFALDYLDNENGFVLMIECGHIDKCSHSKDIVGALSEVHTLIDVANKCYDFAQNRDDTAIIITADHENGGLKKANDKNDIKNSLYSKSSHTSSDVPLYVYNCSFTNVGEKVKNTFIFYIMKHIVTNI